MKNHAIIVGLLICLLFLMSCSVTSVDISKDKAIIGQVTKTLVPPTQKVSSSPTSLSVEVTKTATQSVPTATSTIQPTLTPSPTRITPTPVPYPTFDVASSTLSEEAATQNLIELLETNRGCELPCWWGIVPGKTQVDSIESTFVPLGFDWYRDYEALRDNTPYQASISLTSGVGKIVGKVQSIEVRGGAGEETYDRNEAWRPYAIPRILERLGIPDDIYVFYPFRFDPGGMQAYRLFFYYHDLGVEIDYLGKASLIDEKPGWAQACPSILETDEINLLLFQPGAVPNYLRRTLPSSTLPLPKLPEGTNPYDVVSWEQATESSLDEFWRLFTESEEGMVCFDFKTYWTD